MSKKSSKTRQTHADTKKAEETALVASIKAEAARVREAFSTGPLFQDSPAEIPTATAVAAWSVLDSLKDIIEERKKVYRAHLLSFVEENGSPTAQGGSEMMIDSSTVIREKRQDRLPADGDLKILLASKGIDFKEAFDEVKSLVLNESKLAFLIDSGRLSKKEVDDLKKVNYAMKIKQSDIIEEFLDDMMHTLLGTTPTSKRLKSI